MEKVRAAVWKWLGLSIIGTLSMEREREINALTEDLQELRARVDDLEAAYPDYKKAKAEADEKKAHEVVPGFQPFSRRKRQWEAQHRKSPEKK